VTARYSYRVVLLPDLQFRTASGDPFTLVALGSSRLVFIERAGANRVPGGTTMRTPG
jgi:hypothetical protein